MNLTDLFDASLIRRAGKLALELPGEGGSVAPRALTFADVEARANRTANELVARGFSPGDRLCAQLPNGLALLDLFLACTRLGVILVPVNTQYRRRELDHIVRDCAPRAMVVLDPALCEMGVPVSLVAASQLDATAHSAARPAMQVSDHAPALIIYTSGTTGAAKGAVLSHGALAANALSIIDAWRISDRDRFLAVLPMFHVHGLANGVHAWLTSGCTMRLEQRFEQRTASALFASFQPTLFFGVPTIYVRMLDDAVFSREAAAECGRHMRLFVSGSAPLPAHVLESFQRRFGHTILERYGMTEALMITTNPCDGERRPGSVGVPFSGVQVRLAREDGTDAPDSEAGEIHIKSPHLFSGYWRNEAATRAAHADGWFRTGDIAVRSADGYFTLRGRAGDLIIRGGFNIYPREIEEVLLEDGRVREVAVVGVGDSVQGEVPVAYFAGDASLLPEDLEARCRSQLASFKVPRSFVRVDSLPRTALGKVQKHLLPAAPD
jgi:malonyl-CoA/methylmalonyl-CoA synthetase